MQCVAQLRTSWRDPLEALSAFAGEPWAIGFVSGGGGPRGRWSYVARAPEATFVSAPGQDPFAALGDLLGPAGPSLADGPPFQGGVAGLACYELGDVVEPLGLSRTGWPDLAAARYLAVLAFDHERGEVAAVGRGADAAAAEDEAARALAWLDLPPAAPAAGALVRGLGASDPDDYEAAVAEVVARIHAGEIFQANIARRWSGRLAAGAAPFDLFARLAGQSAAPFAAYLRLPGLAVVSNSPERFLQARGGVVETRPIKGTRPRGRCPDEDASLARQLSASDKDRAENLMIVDLMRNDLARVCVPGSVRVPELFAVESFANVHHLVSTVTGRLAAGQGAVDLLRAAFPPGSITGAPKVQAMKVIAGLETPRGPYCGSLFWAGFDGALDSSVLIRTAGFVQDAEGWSVEARAGAGIVADSDPRAERLETEAKISALLAALEGSA
ncbi:aminodeoxychorismate synthase, component I [Phenylobacterium sp. LH3H17]|uniref:aminodeoxychorismate synthase, component I n=1 Tax=Phenylobacterium sp. LH3H17 TaxID=2903901 RepID=UPI0020C966F9|nr:aminodeoxychorismate synthase, component I [Phenylobacterium sp. LH3H17]UTP39239.1 aminodeoxychorismate synthase, component I [Phenylobacterium sp. LH3H17]